MKAIIAPGAIIERIQQALPEAFEDGAKVTQLTEHTNIHTYSTAYWRWYETERELVEPPREDDD